MFVANRVIEYLHSSTIRQWTQVEGTLKTADIGTKVNLFMNWKRANNSQRRHGFQMKNMHGHKPYHNVGSCSNWKHEAQNKSYQSFLEERDIDWEKTGSFRKMTQFLHHCGCDKSIVEGKVAMTE